MGIPPNSRTVSTNLQFFPSHPSFPYGTSSGVRTPGIPYGDILFWEALKSADLPLAVSWPVKYPCYNMALKSGSLPDTKGTLDVWTGLEVRFEKRTVGTNSIYFEKILACPSCGKETRLWSKHPHPADENARCHSCGYRFRIKDPVSGK